MQDVLTLWPDAARATPGHATRASRSSRMRWNADRGRREPMPTRRLTMAQALILFLSQQHVERDGHRQPFFAGVWGIFGHGNLAGIGQALQQTPELRA